MTAAEILEQIPRLSVLVVGDICLDRWCTYDPSTAEDSRETGIPRIGVVRTDVTPGAGGTVANNLRALGVERLAVLGAVGDDGFGWELIQALNSRGIASDLCVRSAEIQTFTYTKLINGVTGEEDLPRVDFITTRPLPESIESKVCENLQLFGGAFDIVMVSDQAETEHGGLVTPRVRELLAELAADGGKRLVWVDSRMRSELFRHAILKPNQDEARGACMRLFGRPDFEQLRRHTNAPFMIVTLGADGALVVTADGETRVPAIRVERPVDICGAGDSFSAGAVLALAVTGSPLSAARFGNLVSSITIMKRGTGTATPQEVLDAESRWVE